MERSGLQSLFNQTSSLNTEHIFEIPGVPKQPTASTNDNIAMVLPFPEGEVELFSFEDDRYKVFKDLQKLFPEPIAKSFRGARSYGASSNVALDCEPPIVVEQMGSYDVSVVPSYEDFKRLQNDVFDLDKGFHHLLQREYSRGYGFVVCRLREGAKFHPIGYTHPMRSDGKLFIPTKHYHNGSEKETDWDHSIYILNGNVDPSFLRQTRGLSYREESFRTTELPIRTPFKKAPACRVTRIKANEFYKANHDFLIHVH